MLLEEDGEDAIVLVVLLDDDDVTADFVVCAVTLGAVRLGVDEVEGELELDGDGSVPTESLPNLGRATSVPR